MDIPVGEWLGLVLRWAHVVAAISWIGHAFLFNWIDSDLNPPKDGDPKTQGELWMVHGGGFYSLVKRKSKPTEAEMNGPLHWFKGEAYFTWTSGFLLLVVVFYGGGGVYLLNPDAGIGWGTAVAASLASLVVGWLVYDLLWRSPIAKVTPLAAGLTYAFVVFAAWALSQIFSTRAAFVHVGAIIASWMVFNVMIHIIPNMRRMVADAAPGEVLDASRGAAAKMRSKHNNYLVFPVIFLMISNHFPSVYGHDRAWALLAVIVLGGAVVKHVMNLRGETIGVWISLGVAVAGAALLWAVQAMTPEDRDPIEVATGGRAIHPDEAVSIHGVVRFEGPVPPPRAVDLVNCPESGPVLLETTRVRDGLLADAFVWVEGVEGWAVPPVPAEAVVVDQRGCLYDPHVLGARVGQTVAFLNSDPVPHNVRAVSQENPTFNEVMVAQDSRIEKVFRQPEVMVTARCDIHPWMASYIGVVPHPWFAVTGSDGAFAFDGLPPGDLVIAAWHEDGGVVRAPVTVAAGGAFDTSLTFRATSP